ncbi:MAG: hypothetical protein HZA53_19220 [Planctomycetes bacterium]|nr:hypothetical protein [Planctomycetota bacterium]
MPASSPTLCFTCGLATSEPPRLNQLPNGSTCPACRDRLLDALPALLPGRPMPEMEQQHALEHIDGRQDWPSPPEEERL